MTDHRLERRDEWALVAFVLLAGILLVLPIRAMFDERPARYGWQMYSTISHAPEIVVEEADGSAQAVDVLSYMADPRAEIRWAGPLIERLCRDTRAAAVVVRERGDEERATCP